MSPGDSLAREPAAPRRWLSIVGIGEDGVDGLPVEASGRHLGAHLRHRRGRGERGAVRAVGDQRGVDVGGGDHPRRDRQLGGAAATKVA